MLPIRKSKKLRYTYKTEPFSHQKRALKKLLDLNGKGALFMEMGTGKTKVAIDWAGIGFYNFHIRRVLVVAPLSVLGVWRRQISQHLGAPSRTIILRGKTVDRVHVLQLLLREKTFPESSSYLRWVIINYEGIWREPDRGPGIEELLIKWQPDLVIFDESHRLKSPTSKQSRAAYRIARGTPNRLLLTGTSITKSPLDVFGQFRAMNDKIFGTNWTHFKFTYGVWGGFNRYQLKGYHNLRDLIHKVRAWSYRIKKDQCLDLPPKLFETVPVTLSDSTWRIYRDMAEQMIAEIEETHATAAIILVKLLRLSQITSGFIKVEDGSLRIFDDNKLQTCLDLIDDLVAEDHKIVIFVRFTQDIHRISEELKKRGIGYAILSGSVPQSKRDSLIDDFQTNPQRKVFVAQIQAGSLGIELTAADAAIFYSLDYNAANYWQAQDRLHRVGQTRKVTYYHLVVPRTIDAVVLRVLKEKGDLAEAIIHRPRRLLGEL